MVVVVVVVAGEGPGRGGGLLGMDGVMVALPIRRTSIVPCKSLPGFLPARLLALWTPRVTCQQSRQTHALSRRRIHERTERARNGQTQRTCLRRRTTA